MASPFEATPTAEPVTHIKFYEGGQLDVHEQLSAFMANILSPGGGMPDYAAKSKPETTIAGIRDALPHQIQSFLQVAERSGVEVDFVAA